MQARLTVPVLVCSLIFLPSFPAYADLSDYDSRIIDEVHSEEFPLEASPAASITDSDVFAPVRLDDTDVHDEAAVDTIWEEEGIAAPVPAVRPSFRTLTPSQWSLGGFFGVVGTHLYACASHCSPGPVPLVQLMHDKPLAACGVYLAGAAVGAILYKAHLAGQWTREQKALKAAQRRIVRK